MAETPNPMDQVLGGIRRTVTTPPASPVGDDAATEASKPPAPESTTPAGAESGGEAPSTSTTRTRSSSSTKVPRRRSKAASFPNDWQMTQVFIPEAANNRAGSQMRPRRVGLAQGEGKSAGRRYALSIKLAAVDRLIGDDLDTSGFVFGNEAEAMNRVEEAILRKAERILADRASKAA